MNDKDEMFTHDGMETEEEIIFHLINSDHKEEFESDPEWDVDALRGVGGPAAADLHDWYHYDQERKRVR